MRCVSLMVLAGLAAAGYSSFDLVLVTDNTGSFVGPVPAKIHRYDGDSGTYLGSFNAGFSFIMDTAVNPAAGELYAQTSSSTFLVFDYNRGTSLRQFNLGGGSALKFQNNKLYRASGNTLSEVNPLTGSLTTVKAWTTTISDFVVTADGGFALYNASSGLVQGFTPSGGAGALATVTGISNGKISGDGFQSNRFYIVGGTGTANATAFASYNLDLLGGLTATGNGTFNTFFLNTVVDITKSHQGAWISAKNNTGVNSLYRLYSGLSSGDTVFSTPQVTTPGPISVVLAPEPGTMIALGAGALALLRRRKKK